MKIYIPKINNDSIGGGWTFLRNFIKGMTGKADLVFTITEADIVFIPGVTLVDRDYIELARSLRKPIVFRADNVPKKSRNKRSRVLDNMKRYAEISEFVVFQSEWSANYCMPLFVDSQGSQPSSLVIYNGVDQDLFFPAEIKPENPIYLFAYHGKNEVKGFGLAHYLFEMYHRENPKSEFWFINNFKNELIEQQDANFDFWNGEKYRHLPIIESQLGMAQLLRKCTHLIYPAYADAAPNMVLEARASGLEVVGTLDSKWSGVSEMLNPNLDISLDRMCSEYLGLFNLILSNGEIIL